MQPDNVVGVIEISINANPTCLLEANVEGPIEQVLTFTLNIRSAKILYNLIHDEK